MKKLLILSGKGGTGKTTIASSFIKLGDIKAFADCDVDAPNLALVTEQDVEAIKRDYYGMDKAFIDNDKCIECGLCKSSCRFDAIEIIDGKYKIDNFSCEGCSLCERVCKNGAISMVKNIAGELELYKNDKVFSTASLKMGEGNSGLLVTEVKKELENLDTDIAIIDGSPGIGCPVIASITGVDLILIVAEPSISGISDLDRIVKTSRIFNTDILVMINKYDTSLENTKKIEEFCKKEDIELVGKIPFDRQVVDALNEGRTLLDIDSLGSKELVKIYDRTIRVLKN